MIRVTAFSCKCAATDNNSNNTPSTRTTTLKQKRLLITQKKLRANVFDKIDALKKQNKTDILSTEKLWMEIEQLSDMLTTIRSKINTIEENHNNVNLQRNMQLFQDYIHNNEDKSLDL
jgi:hypothetical protein